MSLAVTPSCDLQHLAGELMRDGQGDGEADHYSPLIGFPTHDGRLRPTDKAQNAINDFELAASQEYLSDHYRLGEGRLITAVLHEDPRP